MKNRNILAVSTSTQQGSLALLHQSKDFPEGKCTEIQWKRLPSNPKKAKPDLPTAHQLETKASHSELVTLKFQELLTSSDQKLEDITHWAVDQGPGSFTGIRVGLNMVKTFSYCTQKGVFSRSSLAILAEQSLGQGYNEVIVLMNAFKNQCYFSHFQFSSTGDKISQCKGPISITAKYLDKYLMKIKKPVLCIGDGFDVFSPQVDTSLQPLLKRDSALCDYPLASTLVQMAFKNSDSGSKFLPWSTVKPLYIRASEAEENLYKGLLKLT